MTYDVATLLDDPFLIEMARELSDLETQKNNARKALEADPDNLKVRVVYDASVIVWSRATNKYHTALRAVVLP